MKPLLWTKNWAESNKKQVKIFKTLSSSNDQAKKLPYNESSPLLILAETQTCPRGRGSRLWSPSDFMASWLWIKKQNYLSSYAAGLTLYNIFQRVWPSNLWSLKAPNDIYLDKKKVSGILLETVSYSSKYRVILGLGINVLEKPSSLKCASIQDYFTVNEKLWRMFLNSFYREFLELV